MSDRSSPKSRIYFVRADGIDRIKIGNSKQPEIRVQSLQEWAPFSLRLVATAPGSLWDETWLHHMFGQQRVAHEWFTSSVLLETLIAEVQQTGTIPSWAAPPPGWKPKWEDGRGKKISATHLARHAAKRGAP